MSVDFQQLQQDVISIKEMLTNLTDRQNQPVMATTPADEVLTVQQAADLLDLTTATIYGKVYEKQIPFHKPSGNGRLYFFRSELMDWLRNGRKATASELDEQARQQLTIRHNRRNTSKDRKKGQQSA